MLGGIRAIVLDTEFHLVVPAFDLHGDVAACGCIAQGVVEQVTQQLADQNRVATVTQTGDESEFAPRSIDVSIARYDFISDMARKRGEVESIHRGDKTRFGLGTCQGEQLIGEVGAAVCREHERPKDNAATCFTRLSRSASLACVLRPAKGVRI